MANSDKKRRPQIQNIPYKNNISSVNGGAAARGRVGDAERYRERARGNRKFPNTREKYLTGRDLTTPLYRKRTDSSERKKITEAKKRKYEQAAKELGEIYVKPNVKKAVKQKLSAPAFCFLVVFTVILMGVIYTNITLHEKDSEIINLNGFVSEEVKKEAVLIKKLEERHDINEIINRAVNEFGMVKEEALQKNYLASVPEDKITVMAEKSNFIIDLSNLSELTGILSAVFGRDK